MTPNGITLPVLLKEVTVRMTAFAVTLRFVWSRPNTLAKRLGAVPVAITWTVSFAVLVVTFVIAAASPDVLFLVNWAVAVAWATAKPAGRWPAPASAAASAAL